MFEVISFYADIVQPVRFAIRWIVGDWGQCSEPCGFGVQFRRVECALEIELSEDDRVRGQNPPISLVVNNEQCEGKVPHHIQNCVGNCLPGNLLITPVYFFSIIRKVM